MLGLTFAKNREFGVYSDARGDEIVEFGHNVRRDDEDPVGVIVDDMGHGLVIGFAGIEIGE